jgi:uncharacterized membrane protein
VDAHDHAHDHAHSHAHDAPSPSLTRGRSVLFGAVLLLVAATIAGLVALWPPASASAPKGDAGDRIRATVTTLLRTSCGQLLDPGAADKGTPDGCSRARVHIDEGPDKGQSIELFVGVDQAASTHVGQGVVLFRGAGSLALDSRYELIDVQRGRPLLLLAGLFVLAVVVLGRLRGALSLVGLGLSLVVLIEFMVPALLAGRPAVLTAVVGASAVMILVLVLAHGPNIRTATAMVGTGLALLLILVLSFVFVKATSLTGLTSDEAVYVRSLFGQIDLRGLLLAGIVIGALGILDDITVTQVSTVWELRNANAAMPTPELYAAALRVGRDHIASTVNTLLLAYAGASMPLLVIFATSGDGLVGTATNAVVAEEVVRTLVGSIGLIAAVPVTTALAAIMCPAASVPGAVTAPPADVAPIAAEEPRSSRSWT